ncbi:deoxynucleoside kinase [bacterium]|jgi:dTMP kinase|nr:deoxynucleoside kinase [bacterium]MBT4649312.1 deoxynucleoside kinase [bacterium]MBT7553614.1 deoxynucleoside kinase [bacterium]
MKSGKFIVFDGVDGSGKTTQLKLFKEKLEKDGHQVEIADFPQYGKKSAALVEEYLNGAYGSPKEVGAYRASIFYACDRYAASKRISQWLAEGKIVLSNRYVSSNMIHQSGKIKDTAEREKFLKWLENLEFEIFNIPKPDIILFLYLDPAVAQKLALQEHKHGGQQDIHEQDLDHMKDSIEAAEYVAKKYNWLKINCLGGDGNIASREDIQKKVVEILEKHI